MRFKLGIPAADVLEPNSWTRQEMRLLGTDIDSVIAARLGRTTISKAKSADGYFSSSLGSPQQAQSKLKELSESLITEIITGRPPQAETSTVVGCHRAGTIR